MQESANSALQQVLFNFYRLEIKNFYPTTRKSTLLQHSTKTSKSFCNLVGITFHASSRCGKDICKKKQPTPQKKVKKLFYSSLVFFILILFCHTLIVVSICKIYREKTIEVGVYIDRHLYKNMEEVFHVISVSYP